MYQLPIVLAAAIVFFLGLLFLFALVQVGIITTAFAKLGLSNSAGFLLLFSTLIGSGVNLPVLRTRRVVRAVQPDDGPRAGGLLFRHVRPPRAEHELQDQVVAVNVGGCIIPCLLSAYLVSQIGVHAGLLACVALVAAACFHLAKPIPGVGIGIPVLIPPLITAIAAMLLAEPGTAPHVAYVAGSLGTLIGADLLHLASRRSRPLLDAPLLSIGGAGTFDGIFLTGIIAVLLA